MIDINWGLDRSIIKELNKPYYCKKSVAVLQPLNNKELYHRKLECLKPWCATCGGKNGLLHQNRIEAVNKRLPEVEQIALRQFVFTIPCEMRRYFFCKDSLNHLFGIVQRVIEKAFGIEVGKPAKDGEIKYQLDKGVIAYLHLIGGHDSDINRKFHPHVNVHVIEVKSALNSEEDLWLSGAELQAIKNNFRKALKSYAAYIGAKINEDAGTMSRIYKKINVADVHYKHKYTYVEVANAINYMTEPLSHAYFDELQQEKQNPLLELLILGLKRFRVIRYWGSISDHRYKHFLSQFPGSFIKGKKTYGMKLLRISSVEYEQAMLGMMGQNFTTSQSNYDAF